MYKEAIGRYTNALISVPVADPGFSWGGAPTPKVLLFCKYFAKNCMEMKEFGPRWERRSLGFVNGYRTDPNVSIATPLRHGLHVQNQYSMSLKRPRSEA